MRTSDQTKDLLSALCAARLAFPVITRNREGFSKRTGQKYQYADLNAIIDATEPTLGQHGLVLVQSVEDGDGGLLRISSSLFHAPSGQWIASEVSVAKPDDMHAFGTVCTYQKRYAMQAMLNISTEDDDDAASLNGSSKAEKPAAPTVSHETTGISHPLQRREEGMPGAATPPAINGHSTAPEHPTESHLAALRNLAVTECQEPVDVYEDRLRTTMKISKQASVAPKLLTRTMSMAQYMEVFAYYRRLEAQLAKGKETPGGSTSSPQPATSAASAPTGEGPAVPSPPAALSSAPEPSPEDAAKRDRQRLRKEVAQWQLHIKPEEQEFIITHHPYSKARQLLWGARLAAPSTPLEASAAD